MSNVNVVFTIYKKHDFYMNMTAINDLYKPLVGKNAIDTYVNLCLEADKIIKTGIKFHSLCDLTKSLNLSNDDFTVARNYLEAVGLIKTYYVNNEQQFWFELLEPLSFNNFISNQKFRCLLMRNIGKENYERLEYYYANNHFPNKCVDISKTFNQMFSDQDLSNVYAFNFEQLYKNICANTHHNVVFSKEVKELIENNFATYNLHLSEIEHCIYQSVILTTDNAYVVDYQKLFFTFKSYRDQMNNINLLSQVKINRNSKMFIDHLDQNEIDKVFSSYRSLNAEQYYSAIKKIPLTDEEKSIINTLKNTYCLEDSIINLMIDFSLTKTLGRLNKIYLFKMANTVNNLNLLELSNLFAYLNGSWKTHVSNNGEFTKQVVLTEYEPIEMKKRI